MDPEDDLLIPVEPTRIGEIGIGSFLILAGGVLYVLSCVIGGMFMKHPVRFQFQLITTSMYGTLIIFLVNAKRRSGWTVPEDEVSKLIINI